MRLVSPKNPNNSSSSQTSKSAADGALPELHTHSLWLTRLERAGFVAGEDFKAWGSAGPDFLLFSNHGLVEVKKSEAASAVKAGLQEALDRTDERFLAKNAAFIAVITPGKVRIWHNGNGTFADAGKPDVVFDDSEFKQVIELFKSTEGFKLPLDEHVDEALRSIYGKHCPNGQKALKALLNLHKTPFAAANKKLYFGIGTPDEFELDVDDETKAFIVGQLVNKFWIRDATAVKAHVRHNWSSYQPESKKAGMGKYYTPVHPVELVQQMLAPILTRHPNAYVADLAAGCGAFIGAFEDYNVIGRDIDPDAVDVLLDMGFVNVKEANSLLDVSRVNLGIGADDVLVINGNPPWNDASSMNKRYGTDKKDALSIHTDPDVRAKDLGLSFLKAYAKLSPTAICVLHPLSYLIKSTNFRQLGSFASKFKLTRGVVFSSNEFADLATKTPFPVVVALYEPGEMTFEDIQTFPFEVFDWVTPEDNGAGAGRAPAPLIALTPDSAPSAPNEPAPAAQTELMQVQPEAPVFQGTGQLLVLSHIETIDGLIRKYPPTKGMAQTSDIGLCQYNLRDANSLITSGGFSSSNDDNSVPVQFAEWRQYAYLNTLKRNFGKDFVFGNLSPLVSREDMALDVFLDACGADAVLNNQGMHLFSNRRFSFVTTKFVINDFRRKAKTFPRVSLRGIELPNFYEAFVDFWDGKILVPKDVLTPFFRAYFVALKERALS